MSETMAGLKRSCYCGEVSENMLGQTVTVMGWVNRARNKGQLIFVLLRDRTGLVQLTLEENRTPAEAFQKASGLRSEFVVAATGRVIARTPENVNPEMVTGKVEIDVQSLRILAEADVPPFQIGDGTVSNDLRLKYRYLDLRNQELQRNLRIRHQIAQVVRKYLDGEGFLEIETPMLTKSSPEGARDYLVPSRVHPGEFYALPQSPQMIKQILMVSGMDKYFQIVRCFRDEDLRADRQPEFTQIDMELSFVDIDDILTLNENMMKEVFKEVLGVDVPVPFQRMPYAEAMGRFGSDKPDIRFGMELRDLSALVKGSDFQVFEGALAAGGSVRGICAPGCGSLPRKQIDSLVELAKTYRAKGLAWITVEDSGYKTSLSRFFDDGQLKGICDALEAKPGDLVLICADKNEIVYDTLGALRQEMARQLDLVKKDDFRFLWVTEFPLLEWNEEDNRYYAKHHPFTAPMDEDLPFLETNPGAVRAKAYDMVLNGFELGGGSLRIFQRDLQERMFAALGMTMEEAYKGFSFLLDAFRYGAPPHGGLAFGLDRITMLMVGADSLRDVIAFPKTKDASCPMTGAPGAVSEKQLAELGIHTNLD